MAESRDPSWLELVMAWRDRGAGPRDRDQAELEAFRSAHPPPDSGGPHPISTLLGMRSFAMTRRGQKVPPCDCEDCKPAAEPDGGTEEDVDEPA